MREILFRGKRVDNGEWVYGNLITDDEDVFILMKEDLLKGLDVGGWIDGAQSYEVIPETVGQYTGLKDKNGTRILENDILSAHPDELFPNDEIRLMVVWHDYGWFGKDSKGGFISLESKWVNELFEVVGNKFDNPKLLKGSEENE